MLRNHFLIAIRKMLRYKAHTLINVLGLTIGVASCLIIFLLTRFELSYDNFHPNKDRIYRIVADASFGKASPVKMAGMLVPLPVTLQKELTGARHVVAFYHYYAPVTIPQGAAKGPGPALSKRFDQPDPETGNSIIITDGQYFGTFQYQWLAGNAATSLTRPGSVVLTKEEMTKYFGNISPDEAIGRTVIYSDSLYTTVTGIISDWTGNTDLNFKDFISLSTVPGTFLKDIISMNEWGGWWKRAQAFVELAPGTAPQRIERQFPAILNKYWMRGKDDTATLSLQPLSDLHFNADYADTYSRKASLPTLYGLMGIAGFILLLAATNFINLSTAQSLLRTKEVGIRKVLGSRRKEITMQFLGETLLITVLAVSCSVLITPPLISLLHNYLPAGMRLDMSPATLVFLALITVMTALLAGWYPARVISGLQPTLSLRGLTSKKATSGRHLHRALIVFQFTISVAFILCTVIVARQLHYMLNADLGFSSDAILTFTQNDADPASRLEAFATQLSNLPEVAGVTKESGTPMAKDHSGTGLAFTGPAGQKKLTASFELADTNYLRVFGLRLVAGRNLRACDTIRELLVNETAARQMGFRRPEEALGHIATTGINGRGGPIVGIVRDFHSLSLQEAIEPFFFGTETDWENSISIRLAPASRNPGAVHALLAKTEKIWNDIYPTETFRYHFLDDSIAALYSRERHLSGLLTLAMIIAIAISCLGLLGLATFAGQQRSREMSIRKVLGAGAGRIVVLLTGTFLWPVALAFCMAAPVAWYLMQRWLQGFAYRAAVPWWIFAACGLGAIAIAVLTIGYQAVRTATTNPVTALHAE